MLLLSNNDSKMRKRLIFIVVEWPFHPLLHSPSMQQYIDFLITMMTTTIVGTTSAVVNDHSSRGNCGERGDCSGK